MRHQPFVHDPEEAKRELPAEVILQRRTGEGPFRFDGGPTGCLLIHGLTGTAEEMRYLGDRLNRHLGFTVSGVLLAGHGKEPADFQEKGWPDWYRSAEQALFELARTHPFPFLVGFSMGGLIAMLLALHHGQKVRGLALLATPLFVNRHKARLTSLLYSLPGTRGRLRRQSERDGWGEPPTRSDLEPAHASFTQLKWIMRRRGASLVHPTLILQSKRDPSVPWENALVLNRLIASPRKKMILLARSHHVLPMDLERDQVADEIGEFFLSC
jgi:carboxylesterase